MLHTEQTRHWTGLLVISGSAAVVNSRHTVRLEPAMIYLGTSPGAQTLRVKAGSEAVLFSFDQRHATLVVSGATDGRSLAQLLEHPVSVRLGKSDFGLAQTLAALDWWIAEGERELPGQSTLRDAVLKVVLVAVLRNLSELVPDRVAQDRRSVLLQRFRQRLEAHFRERWRPSHYADALGVSLDWLHEVCTAELGRSPTSLIAERQNHEAKLLLRNSSDPVAVLAAHLGFKDPSHFSKCFLRWNGESPRAFRQRLSASTPTIIASQFDMSDWP
ncbi:MAG: AraC family transcriptional regulator [Pseudomonadota bacterium]